MAGKTIEDAFSHMQGSGEPPKVNTSVWHYTNAAGLLGILTSNRIWASAPQVLNDESEVLYGVQVVVEALQTLEREKILSTRALDMLHEIVDDSWSRKIQSEIFVTSTSLEGDLLTQWRGYANTDGFALRFSTRGRWGTQSIPMENGRLSETGLPTLLTPVIPDWYRVTYIREDQLRLARNALLFNGGIFNDARKDELTGDNRQRALSSTRLMLSTIPLALKHPAFSDEREVRYVGGATDQRVHFRAANGRIVPYTTIGLLDSTLQVRQPEAQFPLQEVRCGPGCRVGTGDVVKRALNQYGYTTANVSVSNIPFIG